MVYSPAFIFSSVYPLGFFLCAGLRLGALRWFQAFLASSARPACASSFCFCSAVRLCSILGLVVVANRSVKPTRLRRAAYFLSLVPSPVSCAHPPVPALRPVPRAFKPFWPPALVQQAPPAILLAALRRFRGTAVFLGCARLQGRALPFGPRV